MILVLFPGILCDCAQHLFSLALCSNSHFGIVMPTHMWITLRNYSLWIPIINVVVTVQ